MEHSAYQELADLLKKQNEIKDLRIEDCRISDDDAIPVIDALGNENCKVTHLVLRNNNLTAKSAEYFRQTLESGNCKLTELNLNNNKLTDVGVEYFSEALTSGKCKLTKLFLSGNELSDAAAEYLRDALKSGNCKLRI